MQSTSRASLWSCHRTKPIPPRSRHLSPRRLPPKQSMPICFSYDCLINMTVEYHKLRRLVLEARRTSIALGHLGSSRRRPLVLKLRTTMDSRSTAWGRRCSMGLESGRLLPRIKSQRLAHHFYHYHSLIVYFRTGRHHREALGGFQRLKVLARSHKLPFPLW